MINTDSISFGIGVLMSIIVMLMLFLKEDKKDD
jgi:hypothetical protein